MYSKRLLLLFAIVLGARAQQHEIGILGGGGFLNSTPVEGAAASVTASFSPGPVAGVLIGHDLYSHWSGEIRYLFEERDARLQSSGTRAGFSGQAHVLDYELVLHARPRMDRVRPYVAAGGGIKVFRGTGAEMAYRPLMEYAYLTRTQELKPMLTVGGGLKLRLGERILARLDFRDQITRFPRRIIAPAPGMTLGGWLHDFVPTVGLSWMF
ncbi:MAG: hypothetical protein LAQ69_02370 [Acidobacteriia bacterium]|nr:hypothetical protein [Terriglobia bacterium]